jgi:hypothetical protein
MNEKVDIDCGSNTILVDGSSISKTTSTTISGTVVPKVGSTTSSTSYTIGSGYTSGSSCISGSFLPQYTTVSYPLSSVGINSSNVHLELSGQILKQLGIDDDYFLSPVYPINQEKNATIPKECRYCKFCKKLNLNKEEEERLNICIFDKDEKDLVSIIKGNGTCDNFSLNLKYISCNEVNPIDELELE